MSNGIPIIGHRIDRECPASPRAQKQHGAGTGGEPSGLFADRFNQVQHGADEADQQNPDAERGTGVGLERRADPAPGAPRRSALDVGGDDEQLHDRQHGGGRQRVLHHSSEHTMSPGSIPDECAGGDDPGDRHDRDVGRRAE